MNQLTAIPALVKFTVSAVGLAEAIKRTIPCIDRESTRYTFHAIQVEASEGSIRVMATDGRRLAAQDIPSFDATPSPAFLVDHRDAKSLATFCRKVGRKFNVIIRVEGDRIRVEGGLDTFECYAVAGRFPRTREIFEAQYATTASIDAKEFGEIVGEAVPHTDDEEVLRGVTLTLCPSLGAGSNPMIVAQVTIDNETPYRRCTPCQVAGPGSYAVLNAEWLASMAKTIGPEGRFHIGLNDHKSQVRMMHEGFTFIIMPIYDGQKPSRKSRRTRKPKAIPVILEATPVVVEAPAPEPVEERTIVRSAVGSGEATCPVSFPERANAVCTPIPAEPIRTHIRADRDGAPPTLCGWSMTKLATIGGKLVDFCSADSLIEGTTGFPYPPTCPACQARYAAILDERFPDPAPPVPGFSEPTPTGDIPRSVNRVELLDSRGYSQGDTYRRSDPGCWRHERLGCEMYVEMMNAYCHSGIVVFLPDLEPTDPPTDYGHKGLEDDSQAVDAAPVPDWLKAPATPVPGFSELAPIGGGSPEADNVVGWIDMAGNLRCVACAVAEPHRHRPVYRNAKPHCGEHCDICCKLLLAAMPPISGGSPDLDAPPVPVFPDEDYDNGDRPDDDHDTPSSWDGFPEPFDPDSTVLDIPITPDDHEADEWALYDACESMIVAGSRRSRLAHVEDAIRTILLHILETEVRIGQAARVTWKHRMSAERREDFLEWVSAHGITIDPNGDAPTDPAEMFEWLCVECRDGSTVDFPEPTPTPDPDPRDNARETAERFRREREAMPELVESIELEVARLGADPQDLGDHMGIRVEALAYPLETWVELRDHQGNRRHGKGVEVMATLEALDGTEGGDEPKGWSSIWDALSRLPSNVKDSANRVLSLLGESPDDDNEPTPTPDPDGDDDDSVAHDDPARLPLPAGLRAGHAGQDHRAEESGPDRDGERPLPAPGGPGHRGPVPHLEAPAPAAGTVEAPDTLTIQGRLYGLATAPGGWDVCRTDGVSYRVTTGPLGLECECPAFFFACRGVHGAECRHIRGLKEAGLIPQAQPAPPLPGPVPEFFRNPCPSYIDAAAL